MWQFKVFICMTTIGYEYHGVEVTVDNTHNAQGFLSCHSKHKDSALSNL